MQERDRSRHLYQGGALAPIWIGFSASSQLPQRDILDG
jgi:hypothetical protein